VEKGPSVDLTMDNDDELELTKQMTKNYLKIMPIWEHHDNFHSELQLLEHDLRSYIKRLGERASRVAKLPDLNLTNKPRVLPPSHTSDDSDIVRIYRNVNGGYAHFDEKTRRFESSKPVSSDSLNSESLLALKEKIQADEELFAQIEPGKPWVKCRIKSVFRRPITGQPTRPTITFRLKAPGGSSGTARIVDVDKYAIARIQNHGDKLLPGKRVIAGLTHSKMLPGIIGHEPSELNNYRYLVLLDDGSASYYKATQIYPIFGQSSHPWLDGRHLRAADPLTEAYLRNFFATYPKRHIIKVSNGSDLEIMRHGVLVSATVVNVDCDTIRVLYKDNIEESIYRGSPRLQKKTDIVSKQLANSKSVDNFYPRLVYYMHAYYRASIIALDEDYYHCLDNFDKRVIVSKGSQNKARKSTSTRSSSPERVRIKLDGLGVNEDRDHIKSWDSDICDEQKSHRCSPSCLEVEGMKTETSVVDIVDEFRNASDLKVPLLLGWKRSFYRIPSNIRGARSRVLIVYEAPCGKLFQKAYAIRRYLSATKSKMDIDYFSFDRDIVLNREFGDFGAYYYVENMAIDTKTGKPLENKNISLLNQYSEERLPADFEYRNETFPHPLLLKSNFSFNHDFKSGCDCQDDCFQRSTCACHRLNEDFFGKPAHNRGSVEARCQYNHKRLLEQVATGIFECNSFCNCSSKCSNRVVQNGIRFRLQVQKTLGKGWGVVTLDDIPDGSFICTYAAELLDDADQYGDSDMYYADLDYITVNEENKGKYSDEERSDEEKSDEGVDVSDDEDDRPEPNRAGKRKVRLLSSDSDSSENKANDDDKSSSSSMEKGVEFVGDSYLPKELSETYSRYPKRNVTQQQQQPVEQPTTRERRPQFKRIHDILKSHDYTLDARMQGNVGRFFNHSCDPNCIVQNVFIETHDLRFPVVAFFAKRTIKALEEITWNYNYKMGCIEGRRIDCKCGSSNCRGRIL